MFKLRQMHPELRPYAEYAHDLANQYGINPEVSSVVRGWQQQSDLRRNYVSCVNRGVFPSPPNCLWPANRPGDSSHNYGLSWDSVVPVVDQANWDTIRRWVGFHVPANDAIHAELPGWRAYVR